MSSQSHAATVNVSAPVSPVGRSPRRGGDLVLSKQIGIEMNSVNRNDVKLCAAAVAGTALVALGVASAVVAQQSDGQVNATGSTVGAVPAPTAATSTPVFALQGISAAPSMTGKAPYWPGQSPNHVPQ